MEDWARAQAARASSLLESFKKEDLILGNDRESKASIVPIFEDVEKLKQLLNSLPCENWKVIQALVETFLDMSSDMVRKMAEGITSQELPLEALRHLHNQFQNFFKLLENSNFTALTSFQVATLTPNTTRTAVESAVRYISEEAVQVKAETFERLLNVFKGVARSGQIKQLESSEVSLAMSKMLQLLSHTGKHLQPYFSKIIDAAIVFVPTPPGAAVVHALLLRDALVMLADLDELDVLFVAASASTTGNKGSHADASVVSLLCWSSLFHELPRAVALKAHAVASSALLDGPLPVSVNSAEACTLLRTNALRLLAALFTRGLLPACAIDKAVWSRLQLGVQHPSRDVREAALCALGTLVRANGLPGEFVTIELASALVKCVVDYQDSEVLTSSEYDDQLGRCVRVVFALLPDEDVSSLAEDFVAALPEALFGTRSDLLRIALVEVMYMCIRQRPSILSSVRVLVPLLGVRELHTYTLRCFQHAIEETLTLPKEDTAMAAKRRRLGESTAVDASTSVGTTLMEHPTSISLTSPLLELVLAELRDGDTSVLESIAVFVAESSKDDSVMLVDAPQSTSEGPSADSCASMIEQLATYEVALHLCARPYRHVDQLRTLLDEFRTVMLKPLAKISLARLCGSQTNVSLLMMILDLCLLCLSVSGTSHEALVADVLAFVSQLLNGIADITSYPSGVDQLLVPALACLAIAPLDSSVLLAQRKRMFATALKCTARPSVTAAAVRYLPLFAHYISGTLGGEEDRETCIATFLPLLIRIMESDNSVLTEAIARTLGSLACVAAGTSVCVLESIRHPVAFKITCRCSSVSFLRARGCQPAASAISAGVPLTWPLWQPFMPLLSGSMSDDTRIAFASESLIPYVVHCASQRLIPSSEPMLTQGDPTIFNWLGFALADARLEVKSRAAASVLAFMPAKECFNSIYVLVKTFVKESVLAVGHALTGIAALGALGCVTDRSDTLHVLRRLIKLLTHPDRSVGGAVHDALQRMQAVRGYPALRVWLAEFKKKIAKLLVRDIPLLKICSRGLFNESNKDFLESTTKSWLPLCIANEECHRIAELSTLMNRKTDAVVLAHLHCILAKLFLHQDRNRLPALLTVVCRLVGYTGANPLTGLIHSCAGELLATIVMSSSHSSSADEKLLRARTVGSIWADCEQKKNVRNTAEAVRQLLLQHFLMLDINYLRPNMWGKNCTTRTQLRALDGLQLLLRLLGDSAYQTRHSVVTLIKLGLSSKCEHAVHQRACELYEFFIRMLDLQQVAPLLGQIFVDVMPFARVCPQPVVGLLRYLIVEHRDVMRPSFNSIPFVPANDAELQEIRQVLQADSRRPPEQEIMHMLEVVRGANVDLRVMALSRLHELLMQNPGDLLARQERVSAAGTSSLLSDLMLSLLLSSRDRHPRLNMKLAECVGILGAVDPVRLDANVHRPFAESDSADGAAGDAVPRPQTSHHHSPSRLSPELPDELQLVQKLVERHLLGLQSQQLMYTASTYTIQKLLHAYGEPLLRNLLPTTREVVARYQNSHYELKDVVPMQYHTPVYRPGMLYPQWACQWASSLLRFAKLPVFGACKGLAITGHGWSQVAHFLLPHLVLDVLRHIACSQLAAESSVTSPSRKDTTRKRSSRAAEDDEDAKAPSLDNQLKEVWMQQARDAIVNELVEVLSAPFASASEYSDVSATSAAAVTLPQVAQQQQTFQASARSHHELALQDVFSCVDFVQLAHRHEQMHATAPRTASMKKRERPAAKTELHRLWGKIDELFAHIPHLQLLLAKAAYSCKAYTRALFHLENHLREAALQASTVAPPLARTRAQINAVTVTSHRRAILAEHSAMLQAIYGALDEPDGVEGVSMTVLGGNDAPLEPSRAVSERAVQCENAGRWQEALDAYDEAMRMPALPRSIAHRIGHVRCLRALGKLETLQTVIKGSPPSAQHALLPYAVQATWRLGQWDQLGSLINDEAAAHVTGLEDEFEMALGRLLFHARRGQRSEFVAHLARTRVLLLMPSLAAASMEAYSRAYPILVKLHILHELEQAMNSTGASSPAFPDWPARLLITQPSLKTREGVLATRATIWDWKERPEESSAAWLELARLSRKSGQLSLASSSLTQAEIRRSSAVVSLERAKLAWAGGQQHQHRALAELQDLLRRLEAAAATAGTATQQNALRSRMLVLSGRWMQVTGLTRSELVIEQFKQAQRLAPTSEKAHFALGKYYDELLMAARGGTRTIGRALITGGQFDAQRMMARLPDVLFEYGEALKHGHMYLFHALPRLLTLWLDYSSVLPDLSELADERTKVAEDVRTNTHNARALRDSAASAASLQKEAATYLDKAFKIIRDLVAALPPYLWLTSFTQVVSRICHKNAQTAELIASLIASVVSAHPHQALWGMASILPPPGSAAARGTAAKGDRGERVKAAKVILQRAAATRGRGTGPAIDQLHRSYWHTIQALLSVCNFSVKAQKSLSMERELAVAVSSFNAAGSGSVLVPCTRARTVALPTSIDPTHVPFPSTDHITIKSPCDAVDVLPSLQKPKKIQLLASDGNTYSFLCKPKDDLRKDSRVMEFNLMINKLLRRDPESRRRNLRVRTYSVVVLNEDCGLIEWVPHCVAFRNIMLGLHTDFETGQGAMKELYPVDNQGAGAPVSKLSLQQQVNLFRVITERYPPKLSQWLISMFGSTPSSWLEARLAFTRSTAVMSMVGYIIGLGDRHGENLLVDTLTGDMLHVDLNCLFWKGRTFTQPERVPFRLTQNIVEGMGATGFEGTFRRTCEITIRLLRHHRDSLLSVLEPFIYDPLMEWSIPKRSSSSHHTHAAGETHGENEAMRIVGDIERALQGKTEEALSISVEGQVHQLIEEATSLENLAQMYVGWGAWF